MSVRVFPEDAGGTGGREEVLLGASPVRIGANAHSISAKVEPTPAARTMRGSIVMLIPLNDIGAADENFFFRGDAGNEAVLTMRFDTRTRTLTYSVASGQANLRAIG